MLRGAEQLIEIDSFSSGDRELVCVTKIYEPIEYTFGGISPPMAVRIGDVALEWVNRVKYLGCFCKPLR